MSKRKGHRRRRLKSRPPVTCRRCHGPADASPGALLGNLAAALNACRDGGIRLKLSHGIVYCDHGYVLPGASGLWATALPPRYELADPGEDPSGADED